MPKKYDGTFRTNVGGPPLYDEVGVEFVILDCLGFLRHFLHFFHRSRTEFLNAYQVLVLTEPNSSVGQPLKEAFLAFRGRRSGVGY